MMSELDIQYIRSQFPVLRQQVNGHDLIYFDNAASTQKPQVVIDAITNVYENYYSNVHRGVHTLSGRATDAYERSRERIRSFINAKYEEEVIITSGTSHSINLVASSLCQLILNEGDEVLISEMEHHGNIVPWQLACERHGASLVSIPINAAGELDMVAFNNLCGDKTKIVALSHVSNVLGTVNPIKEIANTAHKHNALLVVDGAQSIPHMAVDVQELNADFYTFSAHKIYGPTGVGVLYGKKEYLDKMPPYESGGNMISKVTIEKSTFNDLPHKFEPGTPNIAGVIGLEAAINYVADLDWKAIHDHEHSLLVLMQNELSKFPGLTVQGQSPTKASVVSFAVDGQHAFDIGTLLDELGVAVRTGHHCCQPLLNSFGLTATVRASMAIYNSEEEINSFIKKLSRVLKML